MRKIGSRPQLAAAGTLMAKFVSPFARDIYIYIYMYMYVYTIIYTIKYIYIKLRLGYYRG